MPGKPELRIGWATYAAAKHACTKWHYSRSVPAGKLVNVGVWEGGRFIGVVLFGRGASPNLGKPYGLRQDECVELVRIALTDHASYVSRIVAIALKFLRKSSPKLRLVVSFADAAEGHHGGVYQAGGWVYVGGKATHAYKVNGNIVHPKTLHSAYGKGGQSVPWLRRNVDPKAERVVAGVKHKYLMPLDAEMRKQIAPLAKPYPKRTKDQDRGHPPRLGGETPTRALHTSEAT